MALPSPDAGSQDVGALATDPPLWRFAFQAFSGRCVPFWITLWLLLLLSGLLALGWLVGPWAPGALGALGLVGGVIKKARVKR
ncbi:hypothetical protein [Amycolatopsis minnesotensis]|uniref:Uncharacterized protein n=1 Tax=Amycolatopsis minnesotensis TaxID=337894 RepID=A0ABP5BCG3_9PSEU